MTEYERGYREALEAAAKDIESMAARRFTKDMREILKLGAKRIRALAHCIVHPDDKVLVAVVCAAAESTCHDVGGAACGEMEDVMRPSFRRKPPVRDDADAFECGVGCAAAGGPRSEAVQLAGILGGQGWDSYWQEFGQ